MRGSRTLFRVNNYDLGATLDSGQAFRWEKCGDGWEGVIGNHWVFLRQAENGIEAWTPHQVSGWTWLRRYLQIDVDLESILASFPEDVHLQAAVRACYGLRLLRQDVWECLISFICSASKQIVQIRQVIAKLCERYGRPVEVPAWHGGAFAFPSPERLSQCSETELRKCGMGFRAPYVRDVAVAVASGNFSLTRLSRLSLDDAKNELQQLPGVGPKIADCVLLFSGSQPTAFPIDTWMRRVLSKAYFGGRRVSDSVLNDFARAYFGPWAGYAQQYLFHYARVGSK